MLKVVFLMNFFITHPTSIISVKLRFGNFLAFAVSYKGVLQNMKEVSWQDPVLDEYRLKTFFVLQEPASGSPVERNRAFFVIHGPEDLNVLVREKFT